MEYNQVKLQEKKIQTIFSYAEFVKTLKKSKYNFSCSVGVQKYDHCEYDINGCKILENIIPQPTEVTSQGTVPKNIHH